MTAAATTTPDEVVRLAREYLAAEDPAARESLAQQLDACPSDPESVVLALRPTPPSETQRGYLPGQRFETPEFAQRYAESRLYIRVPESYRPDAPSALIIFLHGGGVGEETHSPKGYMSGTREGGRRGSVGDVFDASGAISVGPSALPSLDYHERWCLEQQTDYLRDVILEMSHRYNIDPDRVFLAGQSMGGWGCYHHVQVQPDRFAAVIVAAGAWRCAQWPVIRGTPLWIVHGVNDANWRNNPGTHIDYARITHQALTEQGIEHEYWEHEGGHSLGQGGVKGVEHFLSRLPAARRDPYYPHVVAATPTGFIREWRYPSPDNRWVSIRKRTQGFLPYDLITRLGAWEGGRGDWRLRHWSGRLPGSSVEAVNRGDNRIEATTKNVAQFSVWLHPKMVDFAQPIQVIVNGSVVLEQRVKPCISTALRSFERRRDWGGLYTAELKVDVPAAPPTKDSSPRRKH